MLPEPAQQCAADLQAVIGTVKSGALRVFGDWFGRPHDNWHTIQAVGSRGNDLVVTFDEDEELTVSSPSDRDFGAERFRISRADRVVWRWFFYGRPRLAENRFTIEHWIGPDGEILVYSNVDWYEPAFDPSTILPAVELL